MYVRGEFICLMLYTEEGSVMREKQEVNLEDVDR